MFLRGEEVRYFRAHLAAATHTTNHYSYLHTSNSNSFPEEITALYNEKGELHYDKPMYSSYLFAAPLLYL